MNEEIDNLLTENARFHRKLMPNPHQLGSEAELVALKAENARLRWIFKENNIPLPEGVN